jgi:hypothetical protein
MLAAEQSERDGSLRLCRGYATAAALIACGFSQRVTLAPLACHPHGPVRPPYAHSPPLSQAPLPSADIDLSLEEYARLACALLDVPVYGPSLVQVCCCATRCLRSLQGAADAEDAPVKRANPLPLDLAHSRPRSRSRCTSSSRCTASSKPTRTSKALGVRPRTAAAREAGSLLSELTCSPPAS